jgi:hypothetical protein
MRILFAASGAYSHLYPDPVIPVARAAQRMGTPWPTVPGAAFATATARFHPGPVRCRHPTRGNRRKAQPATPEKGGQE